MAHPSAEFRDPHGANVADARSRDAQERFFFKGSASPRRRRRHGAATKWPALRLDVRGLLGPFFCLEISMAHQRSVALAAAFGTQGWGKANQPKGHQKSRADLKK